MSELETFGAHARSMSTAEHKPECEGLVSACGPDCYAASPHTYLTHPNPACPGCVTDADRALWARLADEVDAYLHTEPEETLL